MARRERPHLVLFVLSALILAGLLRFAWKLPQRLQDNYIRVSWSKRALEDEIVSTMRQYAMETKWIIADRPIYPLLLGKPVPPNVAVASSKRLESGLLTAEDYRNSVEQYNPEQIVLSRFPSLREELHPFLLQDYRLALQAGETSLYLRRDLAIK